MANLTPTRLSLAIAAWVLMLSGLASAQEAPAPEAPAPVAAESAPAAASEAPAAATPEAAPAIVEKPREWDERTVDLFATLPVQDGGRVKPLDTFARFTLLRLNGKRSFTTEDGRKLDSMKWLLDCLFYPEAAKEYAHFMVDNDEVITSIGLDTHEAKRDRYSFKELEPGMHKLFQLDNEYRQKDEKELTLVERQIMNLAENLMTFSQIIFYFEFAKRSYAGEPDTAIGAVLRPEDNVPLSLVLMRMPEVMQQLRDKGRTLGGDAINREAQAIAGLMDNLERALSPTHVLALMPPGSMDDKVWRSPADIAEAAFDFQNPQRAQGNPVDMLAVLERLPSLRDQPAQFAEVLATFHGLTTQAAEARGEYKRVPLEVTYYRMQLPLYSQIFFLLAFIVVALSWMLPFNRWWRYATQAALVVPTGMLITGIVIRCIIRERPPVSTLYETILFITAVAVVVALIIEQMNRQRIIIALTAILGCLGMFLANRYEAKEGVDTMPALIAVLDTNFWLSTHVTTVTMGYAAGMLAGAIAHVYIIGRVLRIRVHDRAFYRGITKMTYGVLCFGLLFATVGTILGGIWANDSWGRFWGWDPKENGALMICLWSLVILHAKMGGYIRDLGINLGAIVLAIIVTFSWWGVNNLGVGLHSYGFTSGVWTNLFIYWGLESVLLIAGFVLWVLGDDPSKSAAAAARARDAASGGAQQAA
jgi:ABC-type transport system involved in cytochrome c biogenesis permease subunit